MRKKIEDQHGAIDRRNAERTKVVETFAAELEHYRSLRAKYEKLLPIFELAAESQSRISDALRAVDI